MRPFRAADRSGDDALVLYFVQDGCRAGSGQDDGPGAEIREPEAARGDRVHSAGLRTRPQPGVDRRTGAPSTGRARLRGHRPGDPGAHCKGATTRWSALRWPPLTPRSRGACCRRRRRRRHSPPSAARRGGRGLIVVARRPVGDPPGRRDSLTADAVVAEALAVAAAGLSFDVVPASPRARPCPPTRASRSAPRTSRPMCARASTGRRSPPAPAARAARDGLAPAEVVARLTQNGLAGTTPVAITSSGTLTAQRTVQTTLATLADEGARPRRPLVVTIGDEVGCARGCPGGSLGRCTAGACWCRAPRTRRAR